VYQKKEKQNKNNTFQIAGLIIVQNAVSSSAVVCQAVILKKNFSKWEKNHKKTTTRIL